MKFECHHACDFGIWPQHNIVRSLLLSAFVSFCVNCYVIFIGSYFLLSSLLRFVLWRVGSGVKELNLGSSCLLNDLLLNIFMLQCPNVVHLDVSYTELSFNAFHG